MSIDTRRMAGISLVELILFILIVSVGLAGILSVMNITVQHSADPMVRKQALAVAESLLEEISLKNYANPTGGYSGSQRALFDDVDDYNGYASAGIVDIDGSAIGALSGYSIASVTVAVVPVGGVAETKRISVTVNGPGNESITLSGYRTNYAP